VNNHILIGIIIIFGIISSLALIPVVESAIPPTRAFSIINTTTGNITATSYVDFAEFIAGSGMTITPNFATNEITFVASGAGLSEQYCTGTDKFRAYNSTLNVFICAIDEGSGGGEVFIWTANHTASGFNLLNVGQLNINAAGKIFLDNGSDTSIRESNPNEITFETGGDDFIVFKSGQYEFKDSGSAGLVNMERLDATIFKLYELVWLGRSDTNVQRQFGKLIVSSPIITNGVEDGKFDFSLRENGVDTEYLSMHGQAEHIFLRKPMSIPTGEKLILDGTSVGDTSIRESNPNEMTFELGGEGGYVLNSTMINMTDNIIHFTGAPTLAQLAASGWDVNIALPEFGSIAFDDGSNTALSILSGDEQNIFFAFDDLTSGGGQTRQLEMFMHFDNGIIDLGFDAFLHGNDGGVDTVLSMTPHSNGTHGVSRIDTNIRSTDDTSDADYAMEIVTRRSGGALTNNNPLLICNGPCTTGDRLFAIHKTNVTSMVDFDIQTNQILGSMGCADTEIIAYNSTSNIWECTTAGGGSSSLGFSGAGATISKGSTDFIGLNSGQVTSTEANGEFYVPFTATAGNLYCFVSANASNNGGNTITVRHNGAGTTLQVTYAAAETGLKSDLTGTYSVSAGDRLSVQVVNTGSGGGTKNIVVETCTLELS